MRNMFDDMSNMFDDQIQLEKVWQMFNHMGIEESESEPEFPTPSPDTGRIFSESTAKMKARNDAQFKR